MAPQFYGRRGSVGLRQSKLLTLSKSRATTGHPEALGSSSAQRKFEANDQKTAHSQLTSAYPTMPSNDSTRRVIDTQEALQSVGASQTSLGAQLSTAVARLAQEWNLSESRTMEKSWRRSPLSEDNASFGQLGNQTDVHDGDTDASEESLSASPGGWRASESTLR